MINEVRKSGKGEVYNVGGHTECTNNQIGDIIVEQLGLSRELIRYVDDRLRHDRRYVIDAMKMETELGWKPQYTFDRGFIETIDWYWGNEAWWRPLKEQVD